jgi:hypothetical protein
MKKNLLIAIVLLLALQGFSQSKLGETYSFTDSKGVQFEIQNYSSLPTFLDSIFWKSQVAGKLLNCPQSESRDNILYRVTDVTTRKRGKIYDLRIGWSHTKVATMEELLSFGFFNYRITISRGKDGAYKIDSIKYLSTEI